MGRFRSRAPRTVTAPWPPAGGVRMARGIRLALTAHTTSREVRPVLGHPLRCREKTPGCFHFYFSKGALIKPSADPVALSSERRGGWES